MGPLFQTRAWHKGYPGAAPLPLALVSLVPVMHREGGSYVLNGHKWWASGAMDPRCQICIFMGKTDPAAATHKQQSMILVPMSAPGVRILRPLTVFGYDDAPHGHAELMFEVSCLTCLVCLHPMGIPAGLPSFLGSTQQSLYLLGAAWSAAACTAGTAAAEWLAPSHPETPPSDTGPEAH